MAYKRSVEEQKRKTDQLEIEVQELRDLVTQLLKNKQV